MFTLHNTQHKLLLHFVKKRFEKGIFAEIYYHFASERLLMYLLPILSQFISPTSYLSNLCINLSLQVWTCCGLFYTDSKKRYIVRTQDYNQFVTARNTELAAYSMIYYYQGKTLGPNMFAPLVSYFLDQRKRQKNRGC